MYTYIANVIRVVDGDTLVVDIDLGFDMWVRNQSIRLEGIDTPEIRTLNIREKLAGNLAKQRVEELVGGKQVIIKTEKDKTEKFGRMLGIILTKEGLNINELLIEERLAVKYDGQSKELVLEAQNRNIEYLIGQGKFKP
jgi:micrococcal nuclease